VRSKVHGNAIDVANSNRIERLQIFRVEGTMEQVRVMLVTLLPAFWLVASDSRAAGPSVASADGRVRTLISICDHGKNGPLQDALARDLKPRSSPRRLGAQPLPNGPAFAAFADVLPRLERVGSFSAVAPTPSDLAGCWQFYWRTALEPRAPSSVS
jgi:hypothetical protein